MNIYRNKNCREVYLAALLYDAIDDNNLKAMNMLLEKGADPNLVLPQRGISSFHRVIGCESLDFTMNATRLILQFFGDPNVKSDDGLTPLHIAAAWGRYEVLQILLSSGGDPQVQDSNYMTPVDYAVKGEFPECVYLLKSNLSVVNFETEEDASCCSRTLDKVLLNNGFLLGEYVISESELVVNCAKENINEYVMNWFTKCDSDVKSTYSIVSTDNECCVKNVPFRKPQRKPKEGSISIHPEEHEDNKSPKQQKEEKLSNESGIVVSSTEQRSSVPPSDINKNINSDHFHDYIDSNSRVTDKSDTSNYKTCSNSVFEQNVFEITEDLTNIIKINELPSTINVNESSIIALSEIYKYEDRDEDIVLFEKRLIKASSECGDSIRSGSLSSKLSSLPDTFDYDIDTLRMELTSHGFTPGPITSTTKRLYLKKLYKLQRQPIVDVNKTSNYFPRKTFSIELEKTRKNYECFNDLSFYKSLEDLVIKEFSIPDSSRKWREGLSKSSFTYLLLDPRVTQNLPCRCENLEPKEVWDVFLSGIFYIGKGKKSRPYCHLYDAVAQWKIGRFDSESAKIKKILDIWRNDGGVVCLHIFHNVIPVEAYTREAAMISAMKLENLTNVKSGDFYGIAATWSQRNKKSLGVYLLYKAMKIFLQDGERQIYSRDIE